MGARALLRRKSIKSGPAKRLCRSWRVTGLPILAALGSLAVRQAELPAQVPYEFSAAAAPRLERTFASITLTYDVVEGKEYEVQAADDLGAPAWLALPEAPHDSGRVSVPAPAPARFFRVVERPGFQLAPARIEAHQEFRTNGVEVSVLSRIPEALAATLETFDAAAGEWRVLSEDYRGFERLYFEGALDLPPLRLQARLRDPLRLFEAIMVGGQSNALLYDDLAYPDKADSTLYVDASFQYRAPSRRNPDAPALYSYNFATAAAVELAAAVPRKRLLIPVAIGGTALSQWLPGPNRFAMSSLFGQANVRWALSAPQGLAAIWWYGHESSASALGNATYQQDWAALVAAWREEAGPVPILHAQVGRALNEAQNTQMHITGEHQRRLETNWPGHHLVVTFDLPLADHVHLSAEAYEILGVRFALAMRQHVYGEPVDGTGPRPLSAEFVSESRDQIAIRFSTAINACVDQYDGQFRVFETGGPLSIAAVERDKSEAGVLIQLSAPAVGECVVEYGGVLAAPVHQLLTNVVRGPNRLPSPRFGPIPVSEFPSPFETSESTP